MKMETRMAFVVCSANKSDWKWVAVRSYQKMYEAEEFADNHRDPDYEFCILTDQAANAMGMVVPPIRKRLSDAYWDMVGSSLSTTDKLKVAASLRHFANDDECECSAKGECDHCVVVRKCFEVAPQ
jgi:hypothetical protein